MLWEVHADLLIIVVLVFLAHSSIKCRAENDMSLVKLPEQKETSDYVSRCVYSHHGNLTCDWTSSQRTAPGHVKMEILTSRSLAVTGETCLEFWHLASGASSGATLRALLKSSSGQMEIWAPPPLPRDAWRQVSVPLNITELGIQVIFEAVHPASVDQTTLKQIGIRRGSCRKLCDSSTELWTSDSTRCLCSAGQLLCFLTHCPKGQRCGPQRDEPSRIAPSGMCTIHRNTDFQTFDGVVLHFMSPCTYVLAKTCSASEALPKFTVEVINVQNGIGSQPVIQQMNVNLDNLRVSLLRSQTDWAVVNGVWQVLPLSLNNDTIYIKSNPAAVTVGTSSGVSVSYDKSGTVHVRIPLQYSDRVCGLCGNFNQLPGDDLLKPDGTKAESATALAESWKTGGSVSCETIQVTPQCGPLDEAYDSNEKYCGLLHSRSGPFASCLPVVGAESHFRACLVGLCSARGDQKVLCEILQDYEDLCHEAGIVIPTWRNSTFCSVECGENSHYNSCANGCPEVCSSLDHTGLCGSCEERCECNTGFKLSGDKCVLAENCGCWYNGKHYERGDITVEGDCVQQCQCMGNEGMQCTTMTCAVDEVCKEKNGIKGCFPLKPATCSVFGDPHYVTFDKLAYSFQGGCAYTLTTTCGGHSTVQFTVIGFNIHLNGQNVTRSKLEAVGIHLEGLDLTLNQSGNIAVDGVSVRLPYSTNGSYGSVWVYVNKDFTILESTFGLKLQLDGHSRVFLQVDERYKYELCGLCGTYSGDQEDDFVMPGGHIASGSFEFGDSWRIHTSDECISHPNDPRECGNDETVANDECSMVFQGAFEACHEHVHPSVYFSSCVYDYCATSGDQATFCESLKSYATACQIEGVELSHWQTGTPCASSSPTTPAPTTPGITSPDQTFCPINCSFDTNVCGWEQLIQDSFDWTRHSGPTPSNLTGPNQDHTTGAGFYMYLEGDLVTHGDSARMLSPSCQLDGPICFSFWYYMYGSATGMALNVYQLQGTKTSKILSIMDNQGPEWRLGKTDLKISGPFKVIIEGIRGSTALSDVAVDDIAITSGLCSDGTAPPFRTTEMPESHQICNLDCSFKNSLCTWSQMITDAFDWTRNNGSTPTEMTGPTSDHTGDGHYIYIEATSVTYGDAARLISSECADVGPQCLQFWYHIYGSADTMGLNIYLLQNRSAEVVWQKRNDQGNMWHLAQVDLNTTLAFQIIFEGRRGSTDQSDVAIDDVTLHHRRCSDLVEPATVVPVIWSTIDGTKVPATSSNETGPRPSTTAGLYPPTIQSNATAVPQVPETTKPAPSNETEPRPSPTPGVHPPTIQSNATAVPQAPETTKPAPSNETEPGPSPTPGVHPPTIQSNATAGPQVPATTKPAPSNETEPRPSPTPGVHPPTIQSNATAVPQAPETTKPAPSNETEPGPSPTPGVHPPTIQSNATAGPQVPATTKPAPSNETEPRPSPTAELHASTIQSNATAVPETTKPAPSNETEPGPSPTPGVQPPTIQSNVTAGPQVPETTKPAPSNETDQHPSHTTRSHTPEMPLTNESQVPTLRPKLSTTPTVVPQPENSYLSTPSCAENSHYTTCIPACRPTCKNLNVPPHCSAETCVSGCVCDDGFVQKGSVCVPLQRCGCVDRNGTTHNLNEVWYTDHCSKKCECEEDDGKGEIDCKDEDGCEDDAVCLQLEIGKYYCKSTDFGKCTIQGDPEYKTFDELKHDFSGTNFYVLVRTKKLPKNLPEIYIEGTNACTDMENDDSSEEDERSLRSDEDDDTEDHKKRLQELKIKVYNHTVELKHKMVFVDGQRIKVPGSLAPGLEIQMNSSQIYLKTDFGLSVQFNENCKTDIILPFLYKRRVEGLCGNFDGRKINDKVKPDGTMAKNTRVWRKLGSLNLINLQLH